MSMLGLTANVNAPSDGSVQQLLHTLGVPLDWEPMVAAEGVLFVVTPETHMNLSIPLPPSGCSFYSEADGRRRAYRSLPALSEATLSAHLLRRQMAPALPIALATPRPTAGFVRSRSELAGVWDLLVELDEAALQRATGLPLSASSHPFLYKLVALLRAPYERTLFVDADVMVLSRTFASDVLRNSLRIHDIAMPVDTGRPGNLHDERTRVRTRCGNRTSWGCRYWDRATADPSQQRALKQKAQEAQRIDAAVTTDEGVLQPPMFGRGMPPVCSCVMAFRRTLRVRRLLSHAAARLAHRLHPTDLTDPTLHVRQSDQEALWLELFTGPPSQQPALLVLPEEYYCPAVAGTKQAIDIAARLSQGLRPAWGYAGKKSSGRPFLPKEELHYLSGGQKDCHAVHVHYALNRLRRLDNLTASGTVHYTLHLMDLDHYCWRREAAGHVGCSVSRQTKQLYPHGSLPAGASDDPAMLRLWEHVLQKSRHSRRDVSKRRLLHCGGDTEAPTIVDTLRLDGVEAAGGQGTLPRLAYLY